jgi:hypothetical protein
MLMQGESPAGGGFDQPAGCVQQCGMMLVTGYSHCSYAEGAPPMRCIVPASAAV